MPIKTSYGTASGGGEKAVGIGIVLIVVAVIVIVFLILRKVGGFFSGIGDAASGAAEALNLKDTAQEKEASKKIEVAKAKANTTSSPWSPTYYKERNCNIMTRASADAICKTIWDSVGVFTDTPSQGFSGIKQCKTACQLSFVCQVFYLNYQRDLFNWLTDKYDTGAQRVTMAQIVDYVNTLK